MNENKENRGQVIRDVIGIVGGLVNNQQQKQQPVPAPPPQKEKTDYTPFIIAGVFTIVSALIISRGR